MISLAKRKQGKEKKKKKRTRGRGRWGRRGADFFNEQKERTTTVELARLSRESEREREEEIMVLTRRSAFP